MSISEDDDFSKFINKNLAGTKTEQNLKEAFCGESQARNKYTFFSKQARKEGYIHIADIFDETAGNEEEHGKIWFKLLNNGKIPKTIDNLKTAADTESYEWQDMYEKFADEAREEGFDKIACLFETIRSIEKMHMTRYNKLIEEIENNTVMKKEETVLWQCSKCGYSFDGKEPPKNCPFCKHPKEYFFVSHNCF